MSFQVRQKTKTRSDQQGSHLKASTRYVVYSRLSGLQPGGVVVVTSSFSDSIVFAVHTRKTALSNSTVFKSFHSGPVHTNADSFESVYFLIRLDLPSTLTRGSDPPNPYKFRNALEIG